MAAVGAGVVACIFSSGLLLASSRQVGCLHLVFRILVTSVKARRLDPLNALVAISVESSFFGITSRTTDMPLHRKDRHGGLNGAANVQLVLLLMCTVKAVMAVGLAHISKVLISYLEHRAQQHRYPSGTVNQTD